MYANVNLIHQRQFPNGPQIVFVPVLAVPHCGPAAVQSVPQQEGISFGTFLAGLTAVASGFVIGDPKASKEAKAAARMALGVSGTFLLNKAFDLQVWPAPSQWN